MSRAIFPLLLAIFACDPEEPELLEVVVMATCSDARCEERIVEAVTLSGEPTSWDWVLPDGSRAQGQMVAANKVDDLDLYDVVATDDDGGSHRAQSAIAALQVKLSAVVGYEPPDDLDGPIVIVPLGASCDRIPVVNIGGCVTAGAAPLGLLIDAIDVDTVTFSALSFAYTSTQSSPQAVWKIGSDEGSATSVSNYYNTAFPAPPVADHFTAYFAGVVGGTSTILASHGPSTSTVYSVHELQLTCNKDGKISQVALRAVDRKNLDFDGDGYPEGEDCDETDPDVNADQGC